MKKKNAYDREKKDNDGEIVKSNKVKTNTAFDPNADVSQMSLPEQLKWNKQKIAWNANQ